MTNFFPGQSVIYMKVRRTWAEGGWWDEIPAVYVSQQQWGRSKRFKITFEIEGKVVGRYVHPLAVRDAQQHNSPPSEES